MLKKCINLVDEKRIKVLLFNLKAFTVQLASITLN